jgi:hypothetical protein
MRSFLKEIEQKFMELESSDYCGACDKPADQCTCNDTEIEENNVTAAVAGFDTPAAFAKPGQWKQKTAKYESVNTPPDYSTKDERYQRPGSEEEEWMEKFAYALGDAEWQHQSYEYPSKDLTNKPGTATKKHKTLKVGKPHEIKVEDILEQKYEQLIEGYRDFKTGDMKPSVKVKSTIQEIAKKIQEIETLVNYNTKLKSESGVTSSAYGPATTKALSKISERLIKISEKIRSLGE